MAFAAMVLAAGLGTRLRPLTDELPKPLCPVGGQPPATAVVARLAAAGARRVVVNVHHLAAAWEGWADGQPVPTAIARERGSEPLGTAGGVAHARSLLGSGDVVIWNGDVLAELDVAALVAEHRARGAFATLAVRPRPRGEGAVGVDRSGDVSRLRAVAAREESNGGDYVGIAVLAPACVAALPVRGCLVGDAWIPALLAPAPPRITTFVYQGPFRDIGSIAEYLEANRDAVRSSGAAAIVSADAVVAPGVALEEVVLGAGCRVDGTGTLRRVVVWPGARATAPLADAVVTPRGVVHVA